MKCSCFCGSNSPKAQVCWQYCREEKADNEITMLGPKEKSVLADFVLKQMLCL